MSSVSEKKREHHELHEQQKQQEEEPKLHGAFASVLILGAFLVVSWVAIYFLFLSR